MTVRDLVEVVLRRWYLMLLGALLSVGALYMGTHGAPLYYTKYFVVLLAPQTSAFPNTFEQPAFGMSPMAGLVVNDYNKGKREALFGSDSTLLFGEGVKEGSRVRLPNTGSQWVPLYDDPNIDVQVVGPDRNKVAAEAVRIGGELQVLLKKRQTDMGINPSLQMTAVRSSPDPIVIEVRGARSRAAVAIAASGAIGTTVAVVLFDRWRFWRRGLRGRRGRQLAVRTWSPRTRANEAQPVAQRVILDECRTSTTSS